MASVAERLRKRRFYPVKIDGEDVHVRALLESECAEFKPFHNDDASFGFVIGCGLLNEDKSPAFEREPDEKPQEFGQRVLAELDLPNDTRAELVVAIMRLAQPPSRESLLKNSERTTTPS
jgi:hypothetical protein